MFQIAFGPSTYRKGSQAQSKWVPLTPATLPPPPVQSLPSCSSSFSRASGQKQGGDHHCNAIPRFGRSAGVGGAGRQLQANPSIHPPGNIIAWVSPSASPCPASAALLHSCPTATHPCMLLLLLLRSQPRGRSCRLLLQQTNFLFFIRFHFLAGGGEAGRGHLYDLCLLPCFAGVGLASRALSH